MIEETYRIPFAVQWPDRIAPGSRNHSPVSLLDVAPTILDACGTGFDRAPDGNSLVSVLQGKADGVRSALMCEYNGLDGTPGHDNFKARMVVRDGLKYIATQDSGIDELYNLETDPYALKNLAGIQQHEAARQGMREELSHLQGESGDKPR